MSSNDHPDDPQRQDVAADASEPEATSGFYVVGIGASAGGLESLERMFRSMPVDSGLAFILVQHLSPDFRSMMDELLARYTSIPIFTATDGQLVQPNAVYLLPPQKEIIIADGRLHLKDKDLTQGLTLPIDHFFRSLAQDCKHRSIAVVLSGTGSDGSRGIVDIHRGGGYVICEDKSTAKFDGMPTAAHQTGVVDAVVRSEEIPAAILQYVRASSEGVALPSDTPPLHGEEAVFELLRRKYEIDFSHYKPTTVGRRIERRLALGDAKNLEQYVDQLRDDPSELNALYKDLLIGVTKFFRDAEPFQELERRIIPDLLDRAESGDEIRVWVAGCATGEEAYSLGILLHEALEQREQRNTVKIFATDVHKESLEHASLGIFNDEQVAEVSARRLKRYFQKSDSGYQVVQELRQIIVFAQHNVTKDAPFTNIDLITCRNLLIYLQPQAQKKTLSFFHFGLRTGYYLLLGSSETPGELADEFDVINEHCKIYRKRRDIRLPAEMRLPMGRGSHGLGNRSIPASSRMLSQRDVVMAGAYDQLLDQFMPPSFLVNENGVLIESFGGAEELLRLKGRRPSHDFLELLDTEAKTSIAGALNRVMTGRQPISFTGVKLRSKEEDHYYRLSIDPLNLERIDEIYYLISLERLSPRPDTQKNSPNDVSSEEISRDRVAHLEDELRYTRENLQATIEELETSNEEMQATNEELVASNEELQSTNEELHSVNEELYTVNAEHQCKIQELAELNKDIEHLMASADIATLFLDANLRIRKFTPQIAPIFQLMEHDVGRPISTFSHRIKYENLVEDLHRVLDFGDRHECEVRDLDDRCYFMRLLPYRTDNGVEGIVMAMVDISSLDEARSRISQLSSIVESSHDAIIGKTLEGVITSWNPGAQRLYGYTAEEAIGQHISLIVPDHLMDQVESWFDQLKQGNPVDVVHVQRRTKSGDTVDVSLRISPICDYLGTVIGASAIARDITELRKSQLEKEASDQRIRLLLKSTAEAIYGLDNDGNCTFVNPACLHMLGYESSEDLLGKNMHQLIHHSYEDGTPYSPEKCPIAESLRTGQQAHSEDEILWRRDGSNFPVELWSYPMVDAEGQVGAVVTFLDITERKEVTAKLHEEARRREHFLAILSHELRNPLSSIRTANEVLHSASTSPELLKESREVIGRQTTQMARLLDDLLDMSRITQNRITLVKAPLDLRGCITDAIASVRSFGRDHEVQIEVELPDDPLVVNGDSVRLQQVIANLVVNAIKYSQPGGTVQLVLQREGDQALIRTIDHGSGIDEDMLHEIFDMFVQSRETIDHSEGGMGLGLTLVRELVHLHQGQVKALSDGPGQGSTFEVRLPLTSRNLPLQPDAPQRPRSSEPQRLVLVEDQEDNRRMLASLLQLEGFEVLEAKDGKSGVELILDAKPQAAIVDIGLPEMDGYEVARIVRDKQTDHRVTLIALTGYGQPNDIAKAISAGFDHHMVKPVEPTSLYGLLSSEVTS